MTDHDRPLVQALLDSGSRGIGTVVRGLIRSAGRGPMLVASGLAMVAIVVVFVALGIARSPGLGGALSGLGAGVIAVFLFGAFAAWTLMWAFASEPPPPKDHPHAAILEKALGPTLRALESVRADAIRRAKGRSAIWVPIGIAGATAVWGLNQALSAEPPGVLGLLVFVVMGAVVGEWWAITAVNREYGRLYQDRVLPQLAARFGDLTYGRPSAEDILKKLERHRILHKSELVIADDEIAGTYRGLAISLVSLRLTGGSGDETWSPFDGLLVEVVLPRAVMGATAVVTGEGLLWNLKARAGLSALELVPIADPMFASHYRVYATDPGAARALLTPAFTARFVALGSESRFAMPGCLAEGDRFTIALPRPGATRPFQPPPYWSNDGGRTLAALHDDIATVLRLADAVIDLAWQSR